MKKTIAMNFQTLRERLGITQDQMAEYLEISRPLISYYENGERDIPLIILEKASNLFGVELTEFYEEDIEKAKQNFSLAFRIDEFDRNDFNSISEFVKMVKNYKRLKRISDND